MHPELRYTPVALIDDNPGKLGKKLSGVPILGTREDIVKVAHERQVDEIIISIPSAPISIALLKADMVFSGRSLLAPLCA
jgi:FlaA1/EpsC-like NDP-sugar epimerase